MSGITYIQRITGSSNNLVQINTSDATATALAVGYLTAQAANITSVNEGAFTFLPNDFILLVASDGDTLCIINSTFTTLLSAGYGPASFNQVMPTLAQFIANYGTPVLMVPAQGANTLIIVDSYQIVQTYGSAPLAAGGAVVPQYGNAVHGAGVAAATSIAAADLAQTASTVYPGIGVSGSGAFLLDASCVNKGIYLSNPTQAFTGGTGSTFIIKTKFHVISTVS
jgi:hypothetical protein